MHRPSEFTVNIRDKAGKIHCTNLRDRGSDQKTAEAAVESLKLLGHCEVTLYANDSTALERAPVWAIIKVNGQTK